MGVNREHDEQAGPRVKKMRTDGDFCCVSYVAAKVRILRRVPAAICLSTKS